STMRGRWRCSTADAFLRPALGRSNLELRTGADVQGLILKDGRAAGVRYRLGAKLLEARSREVVLSAGALKSPHILELSGIGDGERLRASGIQVVHHLPGVGENLMDHVAV